MQTKYPEPVADQLRRALYYTNTSLDVKNALKYYRQAIELSGRHGMDPFSDEVLGIKIEVAHLFEMAGLLPQAIHTLEMVRRDCLDWLESQSAVENRSRILAKMIGLSMRLSEHYADERVKDDENAEQCLVWAVTTALKERQRRDLEAVKDEWLSDQELGAVFEGHALDALLMIALADRYAARDQHHLATPLYLQATGLCTPSSCHAVTLMSNLAASLAVQNPPATAGSTPSSQTDQISAAREWATKAVRLAQQIKPPERTTECDQGCAVATMNLADFAMMDGRRAEAEHLWREGRSLCQSVGLEQGVRRADQALKQ